MRRRWSPSARAFVALSIVCGLAAFSLVHGYVGRVTASAPGSPVRVVVASRALARGTQLQPSMLEVREIPAAFAPSGALHSPSAAAGRTLLAPAAAGEPLTATRLGPPGGPVASLVPAGLRAFPAPSTLPPDAVVPGDHVDVLATYGGSAPHAEIIASDLEVLVVFRPDQLGSSSGIPDVAASGSGPLLMLLTSPEQSDTLANAAAWARLQVSVVGSQGAGGGGSGSEGSGVGVPAPGQGPQPSQGPLSSPSIPPST